MARLQDYPTITPALSDNLLIVQSQGQGLAALKEIATNNLNGTLESGSSIRGLLVDTSIPKGVYFYQTRYASDNPSSELTLTMIYKNNSSGAYSRVWAITGNNIYFANIGSSVPSELSWKLIVSSKSEVTSSVTFTENVSGTNTRFYYKDGSLFIYYQGESKTHSAADTLFTLPSGYRPTNMLYVPFVINNSGYGNVVINTDGKAQINNLTGGGTAGRVYFNCVIPLN